MGLIEVVVKNVKLYIVCWEVFVLCEVDLGLVISCLSKFFEDIYYYMVKIMVVINGVISIVKYEMEFYLKDVVYSFI